MSVASVEPLPDWVIPPPGGFTADAFFELKGLPRHTELIDGSLVFMSPRQKWHSKVIDLLVAELDAQAPAECRAHREMTVRLAKRQVPESDVVVVTTEAFDRSEPSTYYLPADVLLAIEAVSPDSEDRDRDTKPRKYAAAGIPHFWRVECDDPDSAVVYTYERDPAGGTYALTGIFHDRLKTTVPFPLDIPLLDVNARRRQP
ncbi:Uma2 family endonuclease [Allonocardiopsis opalescens]|uniref:Uma2 family endonuclease n=1 Tax=Allonocardiopsis opalescens TaxID=1144618 RepID=A0A2T0QD98_9ACTN|nr:Uma2 family endonuclease [Allonocardiopsis opalescens]PRY01851.1 Uma2 family endonuclease [Allonocardiopsis opalescens]